MVLGCGDGCYCQSLCKKGFGAPVGVSIPRYSDLLGTLAAEIHTAVEFLAGEGTEAPTEANSFGDSQAVCWVKRCGRWPRDRGACWL